MFFYVRLDDFDFVSLLHEYVMLGFDSLRLNACCGLGCLIRMGVRAFYDMILTNIGFYGYFISLFKFSK